MTMTHSDQSRGFGGLPDPAVQPEFYEDVPLKRLLAWLVDSILIALVVIALYSATLNQNSFLGFPLGYFLAGPGLVIIALFTVASFVNRQDAVDRWHGANEDA